MNKAFSEPYIYQISTNPKPHQGHLFSMDEKDTGIGIGGDVAILTGMNDSLAATIKDITKSAVVFISGDVDATTLFELGLAISLGKTVYYVTEQTENRIEALLPYDVEQLKQVPVQTFMQIVEAYT